MPVEHDATSLRDLLSNHARKKLVLPNFQREFVWSLDDQQSLVASMVADVPIGSLLLVTGTAQDFSARGIGRRSPTEPAEECQYLLDGQQRISCLGHAVSDPIGSGPEHWKDTVRDTYWNLRYRWMLRIVPRNDERDLFGFRLLNFPGLRVEPDVIRDFIEYRRINIGEAGNDSAWYNPGWLTSKQQSEDSLPMAQHRLAQRAAQEGLVPLWELATKPDDAKSLHMRALQILALRQASDLQARYADEIPTELLESIQNVRPDLEPGSIDENSLVHGLNAVAQRWVQQMGAFLSSLTTTEIPIVSLPSTEVDRAVAIFEVMNQGGTPLTTFDLVVARMARLNPDQSLAHQLLDHVRNFSVEVSPQLWGNNAGPRLAQWSPSDELGIAVDKDSLTGTFKNAFLNMLSILVNTTNGYHKLDTEHIRKAAILSMTAGDIYRHWRQAADAILRAWAFLQLRCGVRVESDLRNKLMILPLAFAFRGEGSVGDATVIDRAEYWYWSSTLSGTYTERQNDNAIEDLKKLDSWMRSQCDDPFKARAKRALRADRYSDDQTLLREHDDAGVASDVGIYLPSYILSRTPVDFLESGESLQAWRAEQQLEEHHVIPLASARTVEQSARKLRDKNNRPHPLNSPLNRTFIMRNSNRKISGMPVEKYVKEVRSQARLSHCVPDQEGFFNKGTKESEEEYYRRFLARRLELVRSKLDEELRRLRGY